MGVESSSGPVEKHRYHDDESAPNAALHALQAIAANVTRRAQLQFSTDRTLEAIDRILGDEEDDVLSAPAPPRSPEHNRTEEDELPPPPGPRKKLGTVAVHIAQADNDLQPDLQLA